MFPELLQRQAHRIFCEYRDERFLLCVWVDGKLGKVVEGSDIYTTEFLKIDMDKDLHEGGYEESAQLKKMGSDDGRCRLTLTFREGQFFKLGPSVKSTQSWQVVMASITQNLSGAGELPALEHKLPLAQANQADQISISSS